MGETLRILCPMCKTVLVVSGNVPKLKSVVVHIDSEQPKILSREEEELKRRAFLAKHSTLEVFGFDMEYNYFERQNREGWAFQLGSRLL